MIPLTRFGKYTLVAQLGRGGMAEVYLAFVSGPANFRKPVVIKRILADLQSDERLVEMFFDEARLAARLHHPHVVQTYEVGEIDGSHFLAMEYLEGQPLHRLLRMCAKRRVRMPPPIAVRIAVDALDGLDHAHRLRDFDGTHLGVVHRDISPQNVFVTYDGVVKVLDFGIAKSVTQVVQTRVGAIKGKYAYIAPEQARSDSQVDARADIWATGVVLWESLVGQRLFKGETDIATLEASTRGPIPLLGDALPGAPPQLERILERALERDPDRRYPNATAMKTELEHFLRQEPAPVDRAELAKYMRKLFGDEIERHRKLLTACARTVESGEVRDPSEGSEQLPTTMPETPPSMDSAIREATQRTATSRDGEPWRRRLLPWAAVAVLLLTCGVTGGVAAWLMRGGGEAAEAAVPPSATEPATTAAGGGQGAPGDVDDGEAPPSPAAGDEGASPGGAETVATTDTADAASVAEDPTVTATDTEDEAEPTVDTARRDLRRRRAARRRAAARTPATATPMEEAGSPAPAEARDDTAEATGTGRLTLDTVPWAEVFLGGRSLGTTPLLGVELPVGTHVLTLRNPEQGIETQYRVRISSGETTSRRLGL